MKFLFLDIDGVLNSADTIQDLGGHVSEQDWWLGMLDFDRCELLAGLCRDLGDLRIVLSSSWRKAHTHSEMESLICEKLGPELAQHVEGRFVDRTGSFCGITPRDAGGLPMGRGLEIQDWVRNMFTQPELGFETPEHAHICIVDDDSDMGCLTPALVNTSWAKGLTAADVLDIKETLSKPLRDVGGFDGWVEDAFDYRFHHKDDEE